MDKTLRFRQLKRGVRAALFKYRLLTKRLRVLPDYLVIGAMRCGTTFLYGCLTQHPNVAPAFRKEVRFFCGFDGKFTGGLSWYRAHFPLSIQKYHVTNLRKQKFVTGEATPYYFFHPLAPRRVAEVLPDGRFILLLRNPVDRAYSHYNKSVRDGLETLSFEEAIDILEPIPFEQASRIAVEGLEKRREAWLEHRPSTCPRLNHAHCNAYLCWGIYVNYLRNWLEYFPKERILVVRSEDLYMHPWGTMDRVFHFLGVPKCESGTGIAPHHPHFYPEMQPDTRERLIEYFKPFNQQLEELLAVEMYWDK